MGRHKPRHPRRPRPDRAAATAYADKLRCGHCHAAVALAADVDGRRHVSVMHDDGCPVLAETVSDVPDVLRAMDEVGGGVLLLDGDRVLATVPEPDLSRRIEIAMAAAEQGLRSIAIGDPGGTS